MLSAEIIAIGSELLTPQFHDTNSTFLTEQLNLIGITVKARTIVGDEEVYLEHTLRAAMERTEIVVTIGGLGPTEDDITRKVVAQATGRRLILDERVLAKLRARFRERRVGMSSNNERQALVPSDAEVLENSNGTAPGLWLSTGKNTLILLPGPPAELQPMFEKHCCPRLVQMSGPLALARLVFRTTGLGESMLDSRIAPIYTKYKNPTTTVLSKPGQVDIRLTARAKTSAEAEDLVAEVGDEIDKTLGDYIFARDEQTLEEVVGMYLVMKGATVAVAESCTGGMLAERLTSIPGSSQFFESGIVVYSNESKIDLAGIPPLVLGMQGAVSKEVAVGLAESVREKIGTTIGIGITGIAGPTGGSEEKPVGTVHIAVAGPSDTDHRQFVFPGSRHKVRWQSSQAALDMVRRHLATL